MSGQPDLPRNLRQAGGQLAPSVVGLVPEKIRRSEAGDVARRDFALTARVVGELRLGAVIDVDGEQLPVTEWLSELWRADARTIFEAAFESSRERIRADGMRLRNVQPGTFRTEHPEHPAWILHSDLVAKNVDLTGNPVLLVPTSGSAFIAGDRTGPASPASSSWPRSKFATTRRTSSPRNHSSGVGPPGNHFSGRRQPMPHGEPKRTRPD